MKVVVKVPKEDYDKIVDKSKKMDLPPEHILGHLAPGEEQPSSAWSFAFALSVLVMGILATGWIAEDWRGDQELAASRKEIKGERVARKVLETKLHAALNPPPPTMGGVWDAVASQLDPNEVFPDGKNRATYALGIGNLAVALDWVERGADINLPVHYEGDKVIADDGSVSYTQHHRGGIIMTKIMDRYFWNGSPRLLTVLEHYTRPENIGKVNWSHKNPAGVDFHRRLTWKMMRYEGDGKLDWQRLGAIRNAVQVAMTEEGKE